ILIDPGAALGPSRFNLPPADEEWDALKRANDRIGAYAQRAPLVFVSHYHEDHFRYDPALYRDRTVWAKDPARLLRPAQTERPRRRPRGRWARRQPPAAGAPPPRAAAPRRRSRRSPRRRPPATGRTAPTAAT